MAPDLIFGFATSAGGVSAPGAGLTARQTCNGDMTADKVALTPGPYAADFAAGDAGWVAITAAFKAAIDGGSDGGSDPGGDAGVDAGANAGRDADRGPLRVGCGCSSPAGAWGLAALAAALLLACAASSTHRRR